MDKATRAVVEALDRIDGSDPEKARAEIDELMLAFVPLEVRDAFERVTERCKWWA